jgi:hypothetical protein
MKMFNRKLLIDTQTTDLYLHYDVIIMLYLTFGIHTYVASYTEPNFKLNKPEFLYFTSSFAFMIILLHYFHIKNLVKFADLRLEHKL